MSNISDNVKHPSHYIEGRKFEPKDVIRDWELNFNIGSAVKYLSRAGRKDDIVQDLKKAQEFIQFEIDAIEALRSKLGSIDSSADSREIEIIKLEIPEGVSPEDFLEMLAKKIIEEER